MNSEKLIRSVVNLPNNQKSTDIISIWSMLKETGCFVRYNETTEEKIFEFILKHPECVNQWLNWSENKRSRNGWYLQETEGGKYVVACFPSKDNTKSMVYSVITEARAAFVKRELEEIRMS